MEHNVKNKRSIKTTKLKELMSKRKTKLQEPINPPLLIASIIERFTIDDAKEMVNAWERLPEGDYDSETISDWLMDDMKPVIDKFRAKIKNALPTVGDRDSVESHYSGNASKPFWGIVHSLKKDADRQELYSLGVALQNHEEHVLRALWQIKRRYVRGWKNYR